MKSFALALALITGFVFCSFGQSSMKGFKSLDKKEYDKAIEVFTKYLNEDTASSVANLGLAILYSTDDYTGHDFFKAWDYIEIANRHFNNLSADEGEFLKQYFGSLDPHMRNRTNRYNYDFEIKRIEDKLIKYVREENNVDIAEHFIKVYPHSRYYENVVDIRNHIKFRTAEKANTIEAYRDFIKNYPNAAQIPKAIRACQKLAFEEAKSKNTIDAYNDYMHSYPDADQYFEALKIRDQLAFDDAKNKNTIDAMEKFIAAYPKALNIMNARTILRKLLYDRAKQINTLDAYNDFISKYPEGEYFVDIFNLKANALGEKMAGKILGNRESIAWIRGFDFENNNDMAGGIVQTPNGNTIIAGTRQRSGEEGTQSWLISLDNTGKVLWNRAFGSKTYNHANQMMLLPDGSFLVTGWSGSSPDTAFRKAWIFKVDQDGNGMWEKNVEGNEIRDFIDTPDGNYYLSGYQLSDSLKIKMFLEKLNPDFKKLWSRQYSRNGSLNGITMNAKNELVCAAGRWVFRLDGQGYLVWEKMLSSADSLLVPAMINNQTVFCGSRNGCPLLVRLTDMGSEIPEVPYTQADSSFVVACCRPMPGKCLLILENNKTDIRLKVLDEKGNELKSLFFPNCQVTGQNSILVTSLGEVYLTITVMDEEKKEDIGVMKLLF